MECDDSVIACNDGVVALQNLFGEALLQSGQTPHNLHGLQTHHNHLADEPHHILRIIRPVRIIDQPAARIAFDPILIHDPFERGAVAQTRFKHFLLSSHRASCFAEALRAFYDLSGTKGTSQYR